MMNGKGDVQSRARGCLLGLLCGDALGSHVEFRGPEFIREEFPDGLRTMLGGGTHNTIAGQPTDDSEMALSLARSLIRLRRYDPADARRAYVDWLDSGPFDCGTTTVAGLSGTPNHESQANGGLMRVSPIGIFGAKRELDEVAEWARQDAGITHPNPVCRQANALFTMALAHTIRNGPDTDALYETLLGWANDMEIDENLLDSIRKADHQPWITKSSRKQGWVLVALQNSLWQLLNAPDFEEGVVDTVSRGGDTDTNAAICGALLGAAHGIDAIPKSWTETVLNCRPDVERDDVFQPRPERFWPVDALEIADQLVAIGATSSSESETSSSSERDNSTGN